MRLLGIPFILFVLTCSAQIEYSIEDIDLFDHYNNSYRKQGDYFVDDIISSFRSGEIRCYKEGLVPVDTLSQKEFFDALLMREVTYGCEYFFPSDITLLKLISKANEGGVSASHLELFISADHPDNLMGKDRFIGSFRINDLEPLLTRRVWYYPYDNGDSLRFADALKTASHGHKTANKSFYDGAGQLLEDPSDELWSCFWMTPMAEDESVYFRYEVTESLKWEGIVTGFKGFPAWILQKTKNGEISGFERNWNGGPDRRLVYRQIQESLAIPDARALNIEENENWIEETEAPPVPRKEFFDLDQLSFSITSDIIYKDGDISSIPNIVNVLVPFCAKDNVKGVDIPVASFYYSDLLDLDAPYELNSPLAEWELPFDEVIEKGAYYPASYWVLDIYGNEVIVCDADGKGSVDLYGGYEGFLGGHRYINDSLLTKYRSESLRSSHLWNLRSVLLKENNSIADSFLKSKILKMNVGFNLYLHQGKNDLRIIKSMEKAMKSHPNGHKTESTDNWFSYDDYAALAYLDSLETKWNVCYRFSFKNEQVVIEPISVYWMRGDGLEWFSMSDLKKELGLKKFNKLDFSFKKDENYIGINNHGTAIVLSGKPAHEKMPYHSYVLKFVQSLEE